MKKSRPFRFKRFTVVQERAAMRVGTDGVLLGAWCTVEKNVQRALDIGTGTGLIALMLAQRGEAWKMNVDAIEPEPGALTDATMNFAKSPWPGQIALYGQSLQDYSPNADRYDLIACNPPYFTMSLPSPSGERTTARHDVNLSRGIVVANAALLCRPRGRFAVIIPTEQAGEYIAECDLKGLVLSRRTDVLTTRGPVPKRTLLEFILQPGFDEPCLHNELVIETSAGIYSLDYIELTRDFYLKF